MARARTPWDVFLLVLFSAVSAWSVIVSIYEPAIVGSHAVVYTDAAAALMSGGNPWDVGPPMVRFSGPPTMLVPFIPFVIVPESVVRVVWVAGMAALAVWVVRRLRLPAYWTVFPPITDAVVLGHVEVGILWLLVVGGPASGLAALVKPYTAAALLAERRWTALLVAAVLFLATIPLLPWGSFLGQAHLITGQLANQARGGVSVFGEPILVVVAVLCLGTLGPRRALWLSVPLLWPFAQFLYKVITVPQLSPVIAAFWAIPVPGFTLVGIVVDAAIRSVGRLRPLPRWLEVGVRPAAVYPPPESNS